MTAEAATSVRHEVTVDVPVEHAFRVFTGRFRDWWPRDTHHIGSAECVDAVIEPIEGGRWYERGVDGSECDWGRVLVWSPPSRVVLAWSLTADWRYDPSLTTEVDVRFEAVGDERTVVTLEHRGLDVYAERADEVRASLGSPGGWPGIVERFAAFVAST